MRALIVDNDSVLCHWLGSKLHSYGYSCRMAHDGAQALRAIHDEVYDVVLLDRALPIIDGFSVLRELQGSRHPPIMLLSALDQDSDRIMGLELGAEDYLGKPFNFNELRLRLDIMVRRVKRHTDNASVLAFENLRLDRLQRVAWRNGLRIALTDKEINLLIILMENPEKAITRTMLLERVWGYHFDPKTNLIDVHMSKLRAKIDKGFPYPLIKTHRTMGYALSSVEKDRMNIGG